MDILLGIALSQHLNMQGDYNQIHPHIRLQEERFIAGAYYNSEERVSPYAGLRYDFLEHGIELGVVGGYPALGTVLPYARYTYDLNDNVRLFITPGGEVIDNKTEYGVVVGIELLAF
jgi:hypothetical protein